MLQFIVDGRPTCTGFNWKRLKLKKKKKEKARMTRFAERREKIKSFPRTVNNHHLTMFCIGWCCNEHHALRDWTFD